MTFLDSGYSDNHSEGCKSCQHGKWLCIFMTYLCNAQCSFCPSPFKQQDKIVSAFGRRLADILRYMKQVQFTGVSFSGGDCFLVFDRLLKWLIEFKRRYPDIYYWAYTNGLAADAPKLKQLARNGLNEIRFNIAATNYDSPLILKRIEAAVSLFEKVAVEIPSIPADFEKLKEILPILDSIGVAYLNLHEFMLVSSDPRSTESLHSEYILNKETVIHYDPESFSNTKRIIEYCHSRNLNIRINNCSMDKKDHQMMQRRRVMGNLFRRPFEQLTDEGLLRTWLPHSTETGKDRVHFGLNHKIETEELENICILPDSTCDALRIDELVFIPPLGIDDARRLNQINRIR